SRSSSSSPLSPQHMRTLTFVRHDIVSTIRQVVDVVAKYAGGALPDPARARVRGFILMLPQRWANAAGVVVGRNADNERRGSGRIHRHYRERGTGGRTGSDSPTSSRSCSPLATRVHQGQLSSTGAAVHAARRVLTLATESLDMMRGVTGVV